MRDPSRPDGWYCPGTSKQTGQPCQLRAGAGTDHPGLGNCKHHGGATPNGRKHAHRLVAEQAVATYGLPREVDPHTALLEEVHRTAGHVMWLGAQVNALKPDDLVAEEPNAAAVDTTTVTSVRARALIELYQRERNHLRQICRDAIAAGIAEREVRIAEEQAHLLAQILRGVVTDLGHDPESPEVRHAVRRHLTLVRSA